MRDHVFVSRLGTFIDTFVKQKRASGYPYQSSAGILYHFDRLVAEKFPQEATITREICSAWIQLKPGEHPNRLLRRVTPVRQLAKYMKGLGCNVYVIPGHIPNKQVKYEAHIYTYTELKAFFNAIDKCVPSPFSPTRRYVIPGSSYALLLRTAFFRGASPQNRGRRSQERKNHHPAIQRMESQDRIYEPGLARGM